MNFKTIQLLFLCLMIVGLFVVLLMYHVAEAQDWDRVSHPCDKYTDVQDRKTCLMAHSAPCCGLFGMFAMVYDVDTGDARRIILEQMIVKRCIRGTSQ